MTKAVAVCTCATCGKIFKKERQFHKSKDAQEWEEYAVDHYDMCPKCYGRMMAEKEKEIIYADVRLNIALAAQTRSDINAVAIIFSGYTYTHKDDLKEIGAVFTYEYPSDNGLHDLLGGTFNRRKWVLFSSLEKAGKMMETVKNLGIELRSMPSREDIALHQQIMAKIKEKETELKAALAELGEIPSWPEEIDNPWPEGAKWNGKFYGRAGNWSVYFSGEKAELTDAQKKAMEKVANERDEWRKKKKEIEDKINLGGVI